MITQKTIHKIDCARVFKQYDKSCMRCQELMAGAAPRAPWFTPRKEVSVPFRYCSHGSENINPGGYCNVCGNGRDHS